jgi:menaquinone-dependent protoporphyrinogen IX oxidase
MEGLVLYRSYFGNTKQIAEAIGKQIAEAGYNQVFRDVREPLPDLSQVAFIFLGSPTRMARVNRKAKKVLKRLKKRSVKQPVVIFDTYGPVPTDAEELRKAQKWIEPGAAGILMTRAQACGLNVYGKTLRCEVTDLKGPLGEHEVEKAMTFTKEFLTTLA